MEESVYAGSQCFRQYHLATGVATFLGPVYVDWPMLQSNSPESRDFIRLEVVTFVSLSGYREIYGRFSVPPNLYVILR